MNDTPKYTSEGTGSNAAYAEMHRVCATLKRIANSFEAESEERIAIRDASLAYIAVFQHEQLKKSYAKLRLALGGQLTDEIRDGLRLRGINADELDAEVAAELDAETDD